MHSQSTTDSGVRTPTISRRFAIRSGGLAAIAASMFSPASPAVAAPAHETIVIHTDDLVAESQRLLAEYREANDESMSRYDELAALLPPDQRLMLSKFADAQTTADCMSEEYRFAELARHFPALYPVLRMTWDHLVSNGAYEKVGTCCTVAKGFNA